MTEESAQPSPPSDAPQSLATQPQPLTFNELQVLRKAGYAKPPGVPWSHWLGLRKLSHKHEMIAMHAATGKGTGELAAEFGYTQGRMSLILYCPHMKQRIEHLREKHFGGSVKARFDNMLNRSMLIYEETLSEHSRANDKHKLQVAGKVIERVLGKVPERVQIENHTVREIYHMLDKINSDGQRLESSSSAHQAKTIDGELVSDPTLKQNPIANFPARPKDEFSAIDDWVNNLVPTSTGIGTK